MYENITTYIVTLLNQLFFQYAGFYCLLYSVEAWKAFSDSRPFAFICFHPRSLVSGFISNYTMSRGLYFHINIFMLCLSNAKIYLAPCAL